MECPFCNGSGHHNYEDCIKCNGTGEYEKPNAQVKKESGSGGMKTILIWVGFFSLILALVYLVVFLKNIGVIYEAAILSLSVISWVIIYRAIRKVISNADKPDHEKLLFIDPDKSMLSNVAGLAFLAVVSVPFILMAFSPVLLF